MTLPRLIIDKKKVLNNLNKIKLLAKSLHIKLRPHVKTLGIKKLYDIYLKNQISSITVSSTAMAYEFAKIGYKDILIAIPFDITEFNILKKLLKIKTLNSIIITTDNLFILEKIEHLLKTNNKIFLALEIDCFYGRSGIFVDNLDDIKHILNHITKKNLSQKFWGIFSHFGQSYKTYDFSELININKTNIERLKKIKLEFEKKLKKNCILSIGDTPSLKIYTPEITNSIDEFRPGNFIYYDLQQFTLNSCHIDDIALFVLATVISKKNEYIVLHCGSIHLGKEYVSIDNQLSYGLVLNNNNNILGHITDLTQEHSKVALINHNNVSIGDTVKIIPVHSCLVANYMKNKYFIKN